MLERSEIDVQGHVYDPVQLVDEISSTEYYIGVSRNGDFPDREFWRIRKIWKDGTTWRFQFPDGNQDFKFMWNNRLSYTYKA